MQYMAEQSLEDYERNTLCNNFIHLHMKTISNDYRNDSITRNPGAGVTERHLHVNHITRVNLHQVT